jgi:hypothetical protein
MKTIIILFLSGLLFSCSPTSHVTADLAITEISDFEFSTRTLSVNVNIAAHESCWEYMIHNVYLVEGDTYVRVAGRRTTDGPCTQAFIHFHRRINVYFNRSGEHNVRFWSGGDNYIDTTVVVP